MHRQKQNARHVKVTQELGGQSTAVPVAPQKRGTKVHTEDQWMARTPSRSAWAAINTILTSKTGSGQKLMARLNLRIIAK